MTVNGWTVFALVLVVLFLLGQIRIGVRGEYSAEGLTAQARLGPVRFQVYPVKKQKDHKAPKKKKTPKKEPAEQPKAGGPAKLLLRLLPLALEAGGQFRRKLRVDLLRLEVTAGAPDPADAAMIYGRTNAALGAAWQPLTTAFHVKDGRASVRIDFDSDRTTVYGITALSIKVGQVLWLGLYFGAKALRQIILLRGEQNKKTEKNKTERRSEPDGT